MIPAQMTSVAVLWAALKTDVGIQEWSSFWKTESWNKGFPTANGQLVQQGRIEWAGREAHGKKHQLFILFSAFPTSLWRIGQKPTWNSSCVTLCFCLEGNQHAAQCCLWETSNMQVLQLTFSWVLQKAHGKLYQQTHQFLSSSLTTENTHT